HCPARGLAHAYRALWYPRLAQRHDDSPPLAQLAPEWLGNFRRGGRQQDRVEGRFFFPTKKSISDLEVYVFEAKLLNDPFGALAPRRNDFDGVYLRRQARKHRGLITGSGADLKDFLIPPQFHKLAQLASDIRPRNR